jgi:hypothetical protein
MFDVELSTIVTLPKQPDFPIKGLIEPTITGSVARSGTVSIGCHIAKKDTRQWPIALDPDQDPDKSPNDLSVRPLASGSVQRRSVRIDPAYRFED